MMGLELINELKKGDHEAYRILFSRYYEWLCNYVYKLTQDYQLSEDLVQEVMVKFWENRKTISVNTSIKGYLFKSCHNQFLQHIKKEKVKLNALETLHWDILYEVYDKESESEKTSKVNKLHQLINELPQRCKEVFVKAKIEKKKYKDIAEEMDISVKTVEAQMSKALNYLKNNASSLLL